MRSSQGGDENAAVHGDADRSKPDQADQCFGSIGSDMTGQGYVSIEKETKRDDAKTRIGSDLHNPVYGCPSWKLKCRASPIRAGATESARHRSDRLDSCPDVA